MKAATLRRLLVVTPLLAGAVVLAGLALRRQLSPLEAVTAGRVVLFVGSCPYSVRAFEGLLRAPAEVQARIVAVPLEEAGSRIPAVCDHALARSRRAWTRLVPRRLACRWLAADATRWLGIEALPAYAVGGVLMPSGLEGPVFAALGLHLTRGPAGDTFTLAGAEVSAGPAERPAEAPLPPGWGLNQAVGF